MGWTTNLSWFSRRISEPSTVFLSYSFHQTLKVISRGFRLDPPDTSSQPSDTSSKASPEGPCDKETKKRHQPVGNLAYPAPKKLKWQWKIHHLGRCISYWKWEIRAWLENKTLFDRTKQIAHSNKRIPNTGVCLLKLHPTNSRELGHPCQILRVEDAYLCPGEIKLGSLLCSSHFPHPFERQRVFWIHAVTTPSWIRLFHSSGLSKHISPWSWNLSQYPNSSILN